MKASEYVKQLQELIAAEGDLEILTNDPFRALGAYRIPPNPEVSHKVILRKRERTPRFHLCIDPPETKGEKVIRI